MSALKKLSEFDVIAVYLLHSYFILFETDVNKNNGIYIYLQSLKQIYIFVADTYLMMFNNKKMEDQL